MEGIIFIVRNARKEITGESKMTHTSNSFEGMAKLCHKCNCELIFEDHSLIGGDKEYWVCENCGEEKVMFGK